MSNSTPQHTGSMGNDRRLRLELIKRKLVTPVVSGKLQFWHEEGCATLSGGWACDCNCMAESMSRVWSYAEFAQEEAA